MYIDVLNCMTMLSSMITVTNSTLALAANPNGRSMATLYISGLVSVIYIQLIHHGP